MVEARPYIDADYAEVQANLKEAGMFDPVCDSRENLKSMITADKKAILVAEVDGKVVGSIYTTPFGSYVTCIWRLAVAKEYRKQGIGSDLLNSVESSAKKKGAKEIWGFFDVNDKFLAAYYKKRKYAYNVEHKYFAMWKPLK